MNDSTGGKMIGALAVVFVAMLNFFFYLSLAQSIQDQAIATFLFVQGVITAGTLLMYCSVLLKKAAKEFQDSGKTK